VRTGRARRQRYSERDVSQSTSQKIDLRGTREVLGGSLGAPEPNGRRRVETSIGAGGRVEVLVCRQLSSSGPKLDFGRAVPNCAEVSLARGRRFALEEGLSAGPKQHVCQGLERLPKFKNRDTSLLDQSWQGYMLTLAQGPAGCEECRDRLSGNCFRNCTRPRISWGRGGRPKVAICCCPHQQSYRTSQFAPQMNHDLAELRWPEFACMHGAGFLQAAPRAEPTSPASVGVLSIGVRSR
jgi:hypothetical protein